MIGREVVVCDGRAVSSVFGKQERINEGLSRVKDPRTVHVDDVGCGLGKVL